MNVSLSPAQVGAIVYALQSTYQDGTDEAALAQDLADQVYKTIGSDWYDAWLDEFDIDLY